jgi:hypothetical protein
MSKGVALCIPASGRPVPINWAVNLQSLMLLPVNLNCTTLLVQGKHIDEARTELVEKSLALDVEFIFFLDEDTVPPGNIIRRFVKHLQQQPFLDILGGVYVSKSSDPYPLVFRSSGGGSFWNWRVGESFPVTWLGTGACMVRAEVFKSLPQPWFKTTREATDGKITRSTEDAFFCERLLQLRGFSGLDSPEVTISPVWPIWADSAMLCEHHDIHSGKVYVMDPSYQEASNVAVA